MYSISALLEIGPAEELIMAVKPDNVCGDVAVPSDFSSEEFDE